jgi:hypothetical protein
MKHADFVIGYLSYSNRHADLFFELLNRRYEKKNTIVTTNKPFAQWQEVFPSEGCVVSLVNRLVHRSEVIAIGRQVVPPQRSRRAFGSCLARAPYDQIDKLTSSADGGPPLRPWGLSELQERLLQDFPLMRPASAPGFSISIGTPAVSETPGFDSRYQFINESGSDVMIGASNATVSFSGRRTTKGNSLHGFSRRLLLPSEGSVA